jgi:CubicO group peptidase (beta-lactamase class C family)
VQLTPPGTAFSYCNAGFAIAGRMTERVADGIWDRLFAERLAAALGMARTGARLDALPVGDSAVSHGTDALGGPVPLPPDTTGRAMAPAGATAWTTPRDMMAFAAMLLGERPDVLGTASIAAMRALAVAGPTPTFATGWGLGLQRFTADGETFGHDGAVAGQNSFLRIVAPHGLTLALFCNGGDARGLFAEVWAALEADMGEALADPLPGWPEPSAVDYPERYVGRYAVPRYVVDVTPHAEGLHARFIPDADAGDFGAPIDVVMRRQGNDASGELFLTRFGNVRLPTQQRFTRDAAGRRMLLFRGRLFPEVTP